MSRLQITDIQRCVGCQLCMFACNRRFGDGGLAKSAIRARSSGGARARHSHLDSAGYSLDQKILQEGKIPDPEESAEKLFREETWRQILSSLVVCFFSRSIYDSETVLEALNVSGIEIGGDGLDKMGLEILRNKYKFKIREGFDFNKLRFPKRIFETPTPSGLIDEEELKNIITKYKELITRE